MFSTRILNTKGDCISTCQGKMQGKDFTGANLKGADLEGAFIPMTSFQRANLCYADLSRARAAGACFVGADLRQFVALKSIMNDCEFTLAKAPGARVNDSDFRNAKMSSFEMQDASATQCDFDRSRWGGAEFSNTNLYGSRMTNCDFKCDDFRNSDLRNVNFEGSTFDNCYFEGANLNGAKVDISQKLSMNLSEEQIDEVDWIEKKKNAK